QREPVGADRGDRAAGVQLVRRFAGWNVGSGAEQAAAAVWILRGSYFRRAGDVLPDVGAGVFRIHDAGGDVRVFSCVPAAVDRNLSGDVRDRHVPPLVLEVRTD